MELLFSLPPLLAGDETMTTVTDVGSWTLEQSIPDGWGEGVAVSGNSNSSQSRSW